MVSHSLSLKKIRFDAVKSLDFSPHSILSHSFQRMMFLRMSELEMTWEVVWSNLNLQRRVMSPWKGK